MAKYFLYQRGLLNGKIVHGFLTVVNSKKQALKLINEYNKNLTNNPNLKKVLDFTYPLRNHLNDIKKWNSKEAYEIEVRQLEKHNSLDNIENLVYSNKYLSVVKHK